MTFNSAMRAALLMLAVLADVMPSPGRPRWEHTPLPVPPEVLVASLLVMGLARLALVQRRQASTP